jgi:membrane protease subunit (stomatin/prohibitin family)
MAIIDVVKWDNPGTTMVWKFPNSELSTMTQLIVNESQTAILFKDGRCFDVLGAGRHVLETKNIPLLGAFVNLPFGGRSPFAAEVWFVNRAIPLMLKFGTTTPIQVEDPTYGIIVPLRAYGQFGLEIVDPSLLVRKVIGANSRLDQATMVEQFKGLLLSRLKSRIAQVIVRERVGVLEIEAQLDDMSRSLEAAYAPDYGEYGLAIRNFRLMSISVPDDDPSVVELKRAKANAARRRIEGTGYAQERGFDVLMAGAGNPGLGGTLANAGASLGMGTAMGVMMGQAVGGAMMPQGAPSGVYPSPMGPPPMGPPPMGVPFGAAPSFFVHFNGQQAGPFDMEVLRRATQAGQMTPATPVWRQGMAGWAPAGNVPELASLFAPPGGPPPFGGGPPPFDGGGPPPFTP